MHHGDSGQVKEIWYMGITLSGPGISNDVPSSGFFGLRRDIAYMLSSKIGKQYESLLEVYYDKEAKAEWEEETNHIINDFLASHNKSDERVIDSFLFACDCDGKITYGTCKRIMSIIDNSKNKDKFMKTIYGYAGWKDEACRGKDVYEILQACAEKKKPMTWF